MAGWRWQPVQGLSCAISSSFSSIRQPLRLGLDPMPLATEALRGEGAVLVNSRGERFMQDIPGAELAPRDVVARAIFAQICAGERVFLDTRQVLWGADRQEVPWRDGAVPGCRPRSGA